jgi:hypothetical protein
MSVFSFSFTSLGIYSYWLTGEIQENPCYVVNLSCWNEGHFGSTQRTLWHTVCSKLLFVDSPVFKFLYAYFEAVKERAWQNFSAMMLLLQLWDRQRFQCRKKNARQFINNWSCCELREKKIVGYWISVRLPNCRKIPEWSRTNSIFLLNLYALDSR